MHHGANDDIEDGREDFFRPGVEVEKLGSAHEFDRLAYIGDRLVLDCDFGKKASNPKRTARVPERLCTGK